MKLILHTMGIVACLFLVSCSPDDMLQQQSVFVRSYNSDLDVTVTGGVGLDDGTYLMVCNDYDRQQGGSFIKIDANGNQVWQKPMTSLIKYVWSVVPVPGTGFVVLGIQNFESYSMYLCLHDHDGNLLSTDSIDTGLENYEKTPHNLMRLSNGNFVLVGGSVGNARGTIRILSPAFEVLFLQTFKVSLSNNLVYCKAVCELPDASIVFFANLSNNNNGIKNMMVIKADLNGTILNTNNFNDSIYSECANAIISHKGDFLAVTGRMPGNNFGDINSYRQGNGMFVVYDNNGFNSGDAMVSGRININQYSTTGQLIQRTEVHDYPGNGLMNSINPTKDGGYILCGTVNQLNTFALISDTKIFLLKLDANLNTSWSKVIYTAYPSLGINTVQTLDGGYLVTALNKSLNKHTQPLVIKTDANGNY